MKIIDTQSGHRAITFKATETLSAQRLIAALIHKGHTKEQATEAINHLLDCLEEQVFAVRAA